MKDDIVVLGEVKVGEKKAKVVKVRNTKYLLMDRKQYPLVDLPYYFSLNDSVKLFSRETQIKERFVVRLSDQYIFYEKVKPVVDMHGLVIREYRERKMTVQAVIDYRTLSYLERVANVLNNSPDKSPSLIRILQSEFFAPEVKGFVIVSTGISHVCFLVAPEIKGLGAKE